MNSPRLRCAIVAACCAWVAIFGACVERRLTLTEAEQSRLRQYVGTKAPHPTVTSKVVFKNGVTLLGYDIDTPEPAVGKPVTVTLYWHTPNKLEEGERLFSHLEAGGTHNADTAAAAVVDDAPLRTLYPPDRWNAGEYIRDTMTLRPPAGFTGVATLHVGMWNHRTGKRVAVTQGAHDADSRVRTANIRVKRDPKVMQLPSLAANFVSEPLVLDGELSEHAWARAAWSTPFKNTMTGGPAPVEARTKALWNESKLFVAFEIKDPFLVAKFTEQDDHLWQEDCAEIMVDPDGDGKNYFELQVSPRNVSFDTRYDSRRIPGPIGHADWDSELRSGVQLRGTLDDDGDDSSYSVEIGIPWTAFVGHQAPAPGAVWRVNFYALDKRRTGNVGAGWSAPLEGDYHVPKRFGRLRFIGGPKPATADGPKAAVPARQKPVARPTQPLAARVNTATKPHATVKTP